ncbi:hypothetical protein ACFVTY_06145 [Streptomyces sp. NPDC058067]
MAVQGLTSVLVDVGLDSLSVAPDSFAAVKRHVARTEANLDDSLEGEGE